MSWSEQTTNKVVRQVCQVYTRVMGYLRPVANYNIWKKSEFYSRKYFKEPKLLTTRESDLLEVNRNFVAKYGTRPA